MPNFSEEEKQALAAVKIDDLKKKINEKSWSNNMELLMKNWGEKAAGLRFMHSHSASKWKKFSDRLTVTGIFITTVASGLTLVSTSIDDDDIKNGLLFGVGSVGLVSSFIQSLKKFYNAEEKAAAHSSVAKQFGSYYRNMTLQLGMSRADREPSDILTTWALKEYGRLQQEAPNISSDSVKLFKSKFSNSDQAIPDVAEDKYIINVIKQNNVIAIDNVEIEDDDEKNKDIVNGDTNITININDTGSEHSETDKTNLISNN